MPTLLEMVLACREAKDDGPARLEDRHRRLGAVARGGRAALERGVDVFAGYGMSETCPILKLPGCRPNGSQRECQIEALRGKAGRAIPLVELQISAR